MSSKLPPIYQTYDPISLDREYNARESVPSFQEEYDRYIEASLRAKQTLKAQSDIVYDLKSGEKLDIYRASPDNAPLFLWIHGGYWRAILSLQLPLWMKSYARSGPRQSFSRLDPAVKKLLQVRLQWAGLPQGGTL